MSRRTWAPWVVPVLALMLGCCLYWGWSRMADPMPSSTPPSGRESAPAAPADAATQGDAAPARRLQWRTPEPAQPGPATDSEAMGDLSFAQAQPWLEARAAAGDARAALALHQRLMECAMQRSMDRWQTTDPPRANSGSQTPAQVAERAWWTQTSCRLRERCAGSTPAAERRMLPWLVMAARAGDPEARTQFALGQWILAGVLDDLEYVPLYQEVALQWLQQGAAAGHAQAFEALIGLYSNLPPVGMIRPPALEIAQDHVRAAMYLWVVARSEGMAETDMQALLQPMQASGALVLSPAEATAAARWAHEWLEQHPGLRLRDVADPIPNPPPERVQRTTPQCVAGATALARPEEEFAP